MKFINRDDYDTDKSFEDSVNDYRDRGYVVYNVEGGVAVFEYLTEFQTYLNQV